VSFFSTLASVTVTVLSIMFDNSPIRGPVAERVATKSTTSSSTPLQLATSAATSLVGDGVRRHSDHLEGGPVGDQDGQVTFTLNGQRYTLTRETVKARLRGVGPRAGSKHRVRVNGAWYPVKQAFAVATGVPSGDFISHTARRHLAALGFEVHGEIEHRDRAQRDSVRPIASPPVSSSPAPAASRSAGTDPEAWHREENVQAAVVASLVAGGWRILSVADTASKEHGIDVVATNGQRSVGVEVKGYPSRSYADRARAGEVKRTAPSTQAGHWYAQAVLAAMRLRGKRPDYESVIALPAFARYQNLYTETAASLQVAQIAMWWVSPDGSVTRA
jgi:hypothetical protein